MYRHSVYSTMFIHISVNVSNFSHLLYDISHLALKKKSQEVPKKKKKPKKPCISTILKNFSVTHRLFRSMLFDFQKFWIFHLSQFCYYLTALYAFYSFKFVKLYCITHEVTNTGKYSMHIWEKCIFSCWMERSVNVS